jgi:predicted Zn-dependent protease
MSKFRKSRFGNPSAGLNYTPTVSRALLDESEQAEDDAWDELDAVPRPSESDLPLPLVTMADGADGAQDDAPATPEPPRIPRDSLALGELESVPPVPASPSAVAPARSQAPESGPSRVAMIADEHPLWAEARAKLQAAQHEAAAELLDRLCLEQPSHEQARATALRVSVSLNRLERVGVHAAWLLKSQLQSGRTADACMIYQQLRKALPQLAWPEVALVAALSAADATSSGALVLDATNLLIKQHAQSPQAPKALLLSAKHQLLANAVDAATQTLRYLVASYPDDDAAEPARKKLAELTQTRA